MLILLGRIAIVVGDLWLIMLVGVLNPIVMVGNLDQCQKGQPGSVISWYGLLVLLHSNGACLGALIGTYFSMCLLLF